MIDGPTLLADALDAGVPIDEVVAEPGCPGDLLARAEVAGAVVRRVVPGTLARASDTVTPQPVAAIARFVDVPVATAASVAGPLALVLVGVGDPGNVGTLLRSAEASGAGAVVFCDGSADPYSPKAVRSSAGSLFRLAVTRSAPADDAIRAFESAGFATVATVVTAAPGTQDYDVVDLAGPVALVLGSEARGLPPSVAEAVTRVVTIPMAGRTESLNVAMAGTIVCFESWRQRRAQGRDVLRRGPTGDNRLDETLPEAAGCTEP